MPEGEEPVCGLPYCNEWHYHLHTAHVLQRDVEIAQIGIESIEEDWKEQMSALQKLKYKFDSSARKDPPLDETNDNLELAITANILEATKKTALRAIDGIACTFVAAIKEASDMRSVERVEAGDVEACLEAVMEEIRSGSKLAEAHYKAKQSHKSRFEMTKRSIDDATQRRAQEEINDSQLKSNPLENPEVVHVNDDGAECAEHKIPTRPTPAQIHLLNDAVDDAMHILKIVPPQVEVTDCLKVRTDHLLSETQAFVTLGADLSDLRRDFFELSTTQRNRARNFGLDEPQAEAAASRNSSGSSAQLTVSDVAYSSTTPRETSEEEEAQSSVCWAHVRAFVSQLWGKLCRYCEGLLGGVRETIPLVHAQST